MNVVDLYNSFGEIKEPTWLDGRSFSDVFVICVGAGPWKIGRREFIQGRALEKLNGRDLINVRQKEIINFFPLKWQQKFLQNMIGSLIVANPRYDDLLFKQYAERFKTYSTPATLMSYKNNFYKDCGCPKGAKVLSLFLRDSIKYISCFPIDRHVKRWLQKKELPITEDKMINLCLENGISPRLFAIGIAQKMEIKNPDWSIK